jgi:hypothetical protein
MFVEEQSAKFWELSKTERRLLVEAWARMGMGRFAMVCLPWRWVRSRLGELNAIVEPTLRSGDAILATQIAWAIETSRWFTPWNSNCMARAIAAQQMLAKRGIPSTLYIGAGKEGNKTFGTHAWVRCGDQLVTEEKDQGHLTVLATFAKMPISTP